MKQTDILLIVVVVIISGVTSTLVSKAVFSSKSQRNLTAEVVDPITSDFPKPDNTYFNDQAINPTQLIQIGDGSNTDPF